MTFLETWLLVMGVGSILSGIHEIYTRKVSTYVGIFGKERVILTSYVAQLYGLITLVFGVALCIEVHDSTILPIIPFGIFFFVSYFVCCIILQPLQNRLM